MEPVTALGLAAATIQLVDFTHRVLRTTNEICKDGKAVDIDTLQNTTYDLKKLSVQVQKRQKVEQLQDPDLDMIASGCQDVAKELLDGLTKLTRGPGRQNTWSASLVIAFRTIMAKDRIEAMSKRLESYRAQMHLRMVNSLVTKLDLHSTETREQFLAIGRKLDPPRLSDNSQTCTPHVVDHPLESHTGNLQTENLSEKLLQALSFETHDLREEMIANHHISTFRWVLSDSTEKAEWYHLPPWLRSNEKIYWIHGKPGSGKSTLMKYIANEPKTASLLRDCSDSRVLVLASHYFWLTGSPLQQSRIGLLRSLLKQILLCHPSLIHDVYPFLEKDLAGQMTGPEHVSGFRMSRLQASLESVFHKRSATHRFCFFIDGLDECGDDHDELAEWLEQLCQHNSNMKLVLSSRSWNVFEDAFGSYASMKMQDLTRPDIERYVASKLERSRGMKILLLAHPGAAEVFKSLICTRADGVFLWVSLAVDSLLRGFSNSDSLEQLTQRVESLPKEIEGLYSMIFDSIDPMYRCSAARLLLVMLEVSDLESISVCFLTETSMETAMDATIEDLTYKDVLIYDETAQRRLDAYTRGLLELSKSSDLSSSTRCKRVLFIHRSFADFCRTDPFLAILLKDSGEDFDPHHAMMCAKLMQLKKNIWLSNDHNQPRALGSVLTSLWHHARKTQKPIQSRSSILEETEETLKVIMGSDRMQNRLKHKEARGTAANTLLEVNEIKADRGLQIYFRLNFHESYSGLHERFPFLLTAINLRDPEYAVYRVIRDPSMSFADKVSLVDDILVVGLGHETYRDRQMDVRHILGDIEVQIEALKGLLTDISKTRAGTDYISTLWRGLVSNMFAYLLESVDARSPVLLYLAIMYLLLHPTFGLGHEDWEFRPIKVGWMLHERRRAYLLEAALEIEGKISAVSALGIFEHEYPVYVAKRYKVWNISALWTTEYKERFEASMEMVQTRLQERMNETHVSDSTVT
ncbi:hypothetical protein EJ05DRAFT_386847 [Pseudovirgaria hyperparasitica]|uniref:Uncharacterized protein n=1 Tax=Pseudovirgaria hyperparasitica TaxID=470096 RepID=A0A6A6W3A8_9PEZI|nr:uncharacterized protein EJ05DRAFT_386847 [Pseudovirgaria hyperparasitica]KAF2757342.1 hypothetical protein EJ05DRAFT_386847 [Pseudovirgaria hyperparasitica]